MKYALLSHVYFLEWQLRVPLILYIIHENEIYKIIKVLL